ncbi:MAG: hypothetical protein LBR29_12030 [Methylobacteriaceae bacterium]|jgi:hypothetical protein|nr:hypothetical protein [Methylobacteriaceae bacterium]
MADSSRSFRGTVRKVLNALFFGCVLVGAVCLIYLNAPDYGMVVVASIFVLGICVAPSFPVLRHILVRAVTGAMGLLISVLVIQIGAALFFSLWDADVIQLVRRFYPQSTIRPLINTSTLFIERATNHARPSIMEIFADRVIMDSVFIFNISNDSDSFIEGIYIDSKPYYSLCYPRRYYVRHRIGMEVFLFLNYYFDGRDSFGRQIDSRSCNGRGMSFGPRYTTGARAT